MSFNKTDIQVLPHILDSTADLFLPFLTLLGVLRGVCLEVKPILFEGVTAIGLRKRISGESNFSMLRCWVCDGKCVGL